MQQYGLTFERVKTGPGVCLLRVTHPNVSAPKIKCPTLLVPLNSCVHLMQVYLSVNMGIKYRESCYPHVTCSVDLLLRLQA